MIDLRGDAVEQQIDQSEGHRQVRLSPKPGRTVGLSQVERVIMDTAIKREPLVLVEFIKICWISHYFLRHLWDARNIVPVIIGTTILQERYTVAQSQSLGRNGGCSVQDPNIPHQVRQYRRPIAFRGYSKNWGFSFMKQKVTNQFVQILILCKLILIPFLSIPN